MSLPLAFVLTCVIIAFAGCAAHHRVTVCVAETLDRPTGEIRPVLVCGEPEDVDEFMQIKERRSF